METKDLKELRSLRAEQVEVAEKAITEEKPEEAKSALEQIKELDARIEKVEKEVKEIKDEEGKDEPKEDKTNEEPKAQEGEQRNMTNEFKPEVSENKLSAEVRGFAEFLTSKGEVRENVTSVNSEAVIPQDVVTQPVQLPETITNLKDYVNVIKVPTAQGSYPILESATERMISVEELAKNPELANPKFLDVNYKVTTYRGQIAVSEEALQDSTPDLMNLVAENNARIGLNTTNAEIAEVMKSFPAKSVDGTDGIKDILNVDLEPALNVTVVASQSFFNAIDKLKDAQGQYILQNDITSPSGKSLFGRKVEVISDALLGKAGEANAFIADLKQSILFADRAQASVKWVQNDIYGQLLAISQRFDVVKANEKAGYFVTYTAPVEDDNAGA
ncbi:phage major capsid protein [Mammaliicoccus sciuri]|uniref:phage major capsid protein n=1 Tax=Mammaliicoccus sciuri TaxID=1296 RepID=UPI002DB64DA9|nr:phage major capsid protein [Mammaliicoccus sciuri]MEB6233836.1 phage major capsid protein [Mammaliicoccus sciuri]